MKIKQIKAMSKEDREKKLKELKLELVKAKSTSAKTANTKTKDIKKIIARILTINNSEKEVLKNK